jgi:hypothetical protein
MVDPTEETARPRTARRPRQGEASWREIVTAGNEADWEHDLEVRQRLHLGMAVSYIADNPLGPPSQGTLTEFRRTQAFVQDSLSRRHRAMPVRGDRPESAAPIYPETAPPPRAQREEFFIGDTVGFTDEHLNERVGTIVRLNSKTASIAVTDSEGHWRVSYGLLRHIVDL